jgi:hypothetical protein
MTEEQKEGHIHLALEVETTGWVGFGIAESGGMAGIIMGNLLCSLHQLPFHITRGAMRSEQGQTL